MPAKAGIQKYLKTLDSRLRGNDIKERFKTIYESIKIANCIFIEFFVPLWLNVSRYLYFFLPVPNTLGRG